MIGFDAIVGSNDRHFYNWGVIGNKRHKPKQPVLAPIYDSARALLWNWNDDKIRKLYGQIKPLDQSLDKYITESSPRISLKSNVSANHFDLIKFIKIQNAEYDSIIEDLITEEKETAVIKLIDEEFTNLMIFERRELIKTVLRKRFKKLRLDP